MYLTPKFFLFSIPVFVIFTSLFYFRNSNTRSKQKKKLFSWKFTHWLTEVLLYQKAFVFDDTLHSFSHEVFIRRHLPHLFEGKVEVAWNHHFPAKQKKKTQNYSFVYETKWRTRVFIIVRDVCIMFTQWVINECFYVNNIFWPIETLLLDCILMPNGISPHLCECSMTLWLSRFGYNLIYTLSDIYPNWSLCKLLNANVTTNSQKYLTIVRI